ncbi:MAG: DUF1080 domain-containing protein [Verrucomicrobiota bacterium]
MNRIVSRLGALVMALVSVSSLRSEEFVSLFDGTNLDAWETRGRAEWRVEEGVLLGGQDGDPKRAGLIYTRALFQDFELKLDFLIDEHGTYNSGVYLRRRFSRKGPTYQINLGRAEAEEYTGLYLDRWLDKGDELDEFRRPMEWNQLRIRAVGMQIKAWLNGSLIVDFTHEEAPSELLEPGVIALQTYGAEGHAGWVKFRDIRVRRIP